MEYNVSVKDKVIAHLYRNRYVDLNDIYNLPWDITQDGIAVSLGITRAHASIELKKLKETSMVEERQAHVKGGKVKRKCYTLTPLGREFAERTLERAEMNDVDIFSMIDMKRQDASSLLGSLSEKDRYSLGCACALRIPVPKRLLPNEGFPTLPLDISGRSSICDLLRRKVTNHASPEELMAWHSFAADCWLDHYDELGDDTTMVHERLYHLVYAGRMMDACKLVSNHVYELISTTTDDLCETLQMLHPIPERFAKDVISVRIEADMDSNDIGDVRECIRMLEPIDAESAMIYSSDLAYVNGDTSGAMDILKSMDMSNPMVNIRIAKMMFENGEIEGAKMILNSLTGIYETGRIDVAVERFLLLAKIDRKEGDDESCYSHLMKARASVPDKGKRRVDLLIRSMGL